MRKIGLLLIVIALLVSACGGEPIAAPTTLPSTATQPPTPAATPTPSAAEYIERGEAYVDQGELDKAAAEFQAAIRLDPANAAAHNALGIVYSDSGDTTQALAWWRKLLAEKPPPDLRSRVETLVRQAEGN